MLDECGGQGLVEESVYFLDRVIGLIRYAPEVTGTLHGGIVILSVIKENIANSVFHVEKTSSWN